MIPREILKKIRQIELRTNRIVKSRFILCLALGLFISLSRSLANQPPITNAPPHKIVHNWEYITFPLTAPDGKMLPTFSVGFEKTQGFRLDIKTGWGVKPPELFKKGNLSVRLHRANGKVVNPTPEGKQLLNSPIGISGVGTTQWGVMTLFPWGTNALEESWIEASMGKERYWLEIPYGFDRNPQDPLLPSMPGGRPEFVPAMKQLNDHDHLVRWLNVHYDLGKIQNGWRLSLIQSNPFDGESEVVLYRDDSEIQQRQLFVPGTDLKSMYLWDLHTPRTALRVLDADASVINGFCMSIRLHDDRMRRGDTFKIGHNGFDAKRCWGRIEISVEDKSYRVVVPSSLYISTHGHASAD